jgi:hypothetical protein
VRGTHILIDPGRPEACQLITLDWRGVSRARAHAAVAIPTSDLQRPAGLLYGLESGQGFLVHAASSCASSQTRPTKDVRTPVSTRPTTYAEVVGCVMILAASILERWRWTFPFPRGPEHT